MQITINRQDITDALLYRRQIREAIKEPNNYTENSIMVLRGAYEVLCPIAKQLLRQTSQVYFVRRAKRDRKFWVAIPGHGEATYLDQPVCDWLNAFDIKQTEDDPDSVPILTFEFTPHEA